MIPIIPIKPIGTNTKPADKLPAASQAAILPQAGRAAPDGVAAAVAVYPLPLVREKMPILRFQFA